MLLVLVLLFSLLLLVLLQLLLLLMVIVEREQKRGRDFCVSLVTTEQLLDVVGRLYLMLRVVLVIVWMIVQVGIDPGMRRLVVWIAPTPTTTPDYGTGCESLDAAVTRDVD